MFAAHTRQGVNDMRHAIAAAVAIALLSGAAFAQEGFTTWIDSTGQLSFRYPMGWTARQMESQTAGAIRVFVGAGDYECQIWRLPHPQSANAPADAVRQRYTTPIAATEWGNIVGALPDFRNGATASDVTVDTSGAWPTQHATVRADDHEARVTLQGRPGLELITLCQSFDTQDRTTIFNQIAASVDSPQ
jgi:hypothetical protein